jgi:hypothetical protein
VEDGNTVCDFDPEEARRRISVSHAHAPFEVDGHKVNLVDTPGYADFVGDVAAALRAVDLVVCVVSAVEGVEVQTEVTNEKSRFSTLVSINVKGADGEVATVSGTLAADGSPRLVQWNDFKMDAQFMGNILVIRNDDKPGVIGSIGTELGNAGINVERMQVGLSDAGNDAASLWALSTPLSADLLEKIRSTRDVKQAFSIAVN